IFPFNDCAGSDDVWAASTGVTMAVLVAYGKNCAFCDRRPRFTSAVMRVCSGSFSVVPNAPRYAELSGGLIMRPVAGPPTPVAAAPVPTVTANASVTRNGLSNTRDGT